MLRFIRDLRKSGKIVVRVEGHCETCGTWRYSLHKDHKHPKGLGGGNTAKNKQYICANCHQDKTREDLAAIILTPDWIGKVTAGSRSFWRSLAGQKQRQLNSVRQTRKSHTKASRKKLSEISKSLWQDPVWRKKMIEARYASGMYGRKT